METVKTVPESDYELLEKIVEEYLGGTENIKAICRDYPATVAGYYIDDRLVGCAYGFPSPWGDDKCFSLDGIAIEWDYKAQGRGSKLLQFWEKCVYELGFSRVDVGSAGGYVEHFYLKNGYKPIELKILVEGDGWKEKQKGYAFPVAELQTQGEYNKLVIKAASCDEMDKDEVTGHYGGVESFYVFGKVLI
ncbi:MAG: GNAT family N-acetyltransferase [Firmicutes bacterium]|nr:GNAT family N-acetyltransferase [Bacillota bacterium]